MGHYSGPRREHWADWSLGLLSAPFPMALLSAKGGTNFRSGSLTWRRIWLQLFSQGQLITGVAHTGFRAPATAIRVFYFRIAQLLCFFLPQCYKQAKSKKLSEYA